MEVRIKMSKKHQTPVHLQDQTTSVYGDDGDGLSHLNRRIYESHESFEPKKTCYFNIIETLH